jgi:hypothetical protein
MLDTTGLANGAHVLRLEVADRLTGRVGVAEQSFQVQHAPTFGVGITSPVLDAPQNGIVMVQSTVFGGRRAGGVDAPVSTWYRIDGGAWQSMSRVSSGRFQGAWDTRSLPLGNHHLEVVATDYLGGLAWASRTVAVRGWTPLSVSLTSPSGTVDGILPVTATVTGGARAVDLLRPVSMWYRVDKGPWQPMAAGAGAEHIGFWDTATVTPGKHTFEVAANDWGGGSATVSRTVTVAARPAMSLTVVSPTPDQHGASPIQLVARAVSAKRAPSGISVWYRIGTGPYSAMTLGTDGYFRASVWSSAPNGAALDLELVANDYSGGVAGASVHYVIQR